MKTIAILEGWAGGPWHTKQFRRALAEAGYKIAPKSTADIIFANSAGCYDIPLGVSAKLVVLVDAPYWPGKHLLRRLFVKVKTDSKTVIERFGWKHFLAKKFWELLYILIQPRYTWLGISQHNKTIFLDNLKNKPVIFIRNELDDFCDPNIAKHLQTYKNVQLVNLPGEHDDYYYNPAPYIEIIENNS